jgi:hypothetical protein
MDRASGARNATELSGTGSQQDSVEMHDSILSGSSPLSVELLARAFVFSVLPIAFVYNVAYYTGLLRTRCSSDSGGDIVNELAVLSEVAMSYLTAMIYIHTAISLAALALGVPVVAQLFGDRYASRWTTWFLVTAVATSVTGFLFPFVGVTPAFAVGVVALAVLGVALVARYGFQVAGHWRWIYASSIVISVYLLAFVGVVQAFQKVPVLSAAAPTQTELPFVVAQIGTLGAFIVLAVLAAIKFKGLVEKVTESPLVG